MTGEYPEAGDLRQMIVDKPIPQLAEDIMRGEPNDLGHAVEQARQVVGHFVTSLTSGNAEALANCFFSTQAYWKDNLALTCHLRTFENRKVIARSLVQASGLRGGIAHLELVESSVVFILATPNLVGVAAADRMYLALQEPNRYAATRAAGLSVLNSTDPSCALLHNLVERGGSHHVDIGGTKLIDEGKLKVKAGVEPLAFTKQGLVFSDDSKLKETQ